MNTKLMLFKYFGIVSGRLYQLFFILETLLLCSAAGE